MTREEFIIYVRTLRLPRTTNYNKGLNDGIDLAIEEYEKYFNEINQQSNEILGRC